MPDLQTTIRDIGARATALRPNLLPQLQQRLASSGRGQLLGRFMGGGQQSAPAQGMSMFRLPGMAGYGPSASPMHGEYRSDAGGMSLPNYPSGFRPPT